MSRLSTITDYRTEMKFANVGNFCNMFSALLHSLPIKWPPKEAGGGGGGGSEVDFHFFIVSYRGEC